MINFTNKFDDKCENWGVFVSADKLLLKTSKLEVEDMVKINKFLKKIQKSKDEKKIHSFDLSEDKRCFIIILKEKLINFELNNLGGSFRNLVASNKGLNKINLLISENLKNKNLSEEELVSEFMYGYVLKSYSFDKYKFLLNVLFSFFQSPY